MSLQCYQCDDNTCSQEHLLAKCDKAFACFVHYTIDNNGDYKYNSRGCVLEETPRRYTDGYNSDCKNVDFEPIDHHENHCTRYCDSDRCNGIEYDPDKQILEKMGLAQLFRNPIFHGFLVFIIITVFILCAYLACTRSLPCCNDDDDEYNQQWSSEMDDHLPQPQFIQTQGPVFRPGQPYQEDGPEMYEQRSPSQTKFSEGQKVSDYNHSIDGQQRNGIHRDAFAFNGAGSRDGRGESISMVPPPGVTDAVGGSQSAFHKYTNEIQQEDKYQTNIRTAVYSSSQGPSANTVDTLGPMPHIQNEQVDNMSDDEALENELVTTTQARQSLMKATPARSFTSLVGSQRNIQQNRQRLLSQPRTPTTAPK